MSNSTEQNHLPKDPKQWVKDLEAIWKAHDGEAAAQGYTDDAVLHWGANQLQSGKALRARPKEWFAFATDLQIDKTYIETGEFQIDLAGQLLAARAHFRTPYDPKSERVKTD